MGPSADEPRAGTGGAHAADGHSKARSAKSARAKGSKQAEPAQGGRGHLAVSLSAGEPLVPASEATPESAQAGRGTGSRKAKAATRAAVDSETSAQQQHTPAAREHLKPVGYFERTPAAQGATSASGIAVSAGAREAQPGPSGGSRQIRHQQALSTGDSQAGQHDKHKPPTTTAPEQGAMSLNRAAPAAAEPKRRRGRRAEKDRGSAEVPALSPDAVPNGESSSRAAGRPNETGPARQQGEKGPSMDPALAEVQPRMKHLSVSTPPGAATRPALDHLPATSRSSRSGSGSRAVKSASAEARGGAQGRPSPLPRAFQLSLAGLSGFSANSGRVALPGEGYQP